MTNDRNENSVQGLKDITTSELLSSREEQLFVSSSGKRTNESFKANRENIKHVSDNQEINVEALQSSAADELQALALQEPRRFNKFQPFLHLLIWLVMTG